MQAVANIPILCISSQAEFVHQEVLWTLLVTMWPAMRVAAKKS